MTQKPARILIVDDDASVALMIREVLEGEGHHVTTFHTGQDGVRVFTRERFDLVMQDVNLPGGVSGYGACQSYKSIRGATVVIMMTGEFTSDQDEALARRLGADGFLRKPFTRERLLQAVDEGLKGRTEWVEDRPVFVCRVCGVRFAVRDAISRVESFPVYCPNCGQVTQVKPEELGWETAEERRAARGSEARRILVVDDDELFRRFLTDLLTRAGHVVLEAKNGKEGLEFCRQWEPELVVADLLLPEMDGITMCRQIRESPRTAQIPILVLTAFQSDASREETRKMKATYLTKPIEPGKFLDAVARMVNR
jgi:DNA-binding response OmpR family regulator